MGSQRVRHDWVTSLTFIFTEKRTLNQWSVLHLYQFYKTSTDLNLWKGIALSTEGNIRSINARTNGTKYTVFETGSLFPLSYPPVWRLTKHTERWSSQIRKEEMMVGNHHLYTETPLVQFSSVQLLSHVQLFATPWIAARQASLSITISWSSLRLTSIESVMPSSHLILGCPLLLLPSIPPSIRVFSNESTLLMRWPEYWSFSFSIISSKEIPGLISFWMVGSPCSPRNSQESSPIPQFKSINSSVLSFLHSPTFTSIHDYRKNHSLD